VAESEIDGDVVALAEIETIADNDIVGEIVVVIRGDDDAEPLVIGDKEIVVDDEGVTVRETDSVPIPGDAVAAAFDGEPDCVMRPFDAETQADAGAEDEIESDEVNDGGIVKVPEGDSETLNDVEPDKEGSAEPDGDRLAV
jgi:hypothetical protein